jgi:hypothetical protein
MQQTQYYCVIVFCNNVFHSPWQWAERDRIMNEWKVLKYIIIWTCDN